MNILGTKEAFVIHRCFVDLAEAVGLGLFLLSLWVWAQALAGITGV
jgi:hypothetical protein